MGTVHEDAAEALFDHLMGTKDGAIAIQEYVQGLAKGRWGDEYLEAIGQQHSRAGKWGYPQIAAFAYVHSDLMSGYVCEASIVLRSTPSADREREVNAAKLANLPYPFVAEVNMSQNNADQDGWLRWTEPIKADKALNVCYTDGVHGKQVLQVLVEIPPGKVPLEIGTTKPSRTLHHFRYDAGVARWPYDHHRIRVYVATKPALAGAWTWDALPPWIANEVREDGSYA